MSAPTLARRQGRVLAMQALFELDAAGRDAGQALETLADDQQPPPQARAFAADVVAGVLANLEAIDGAIAAAAPQWPLEQMARVDKAVLRVAVFELVHARTAPTKVVINEAIEIAKEYGGEGSGRFVNGVLGHVAGTAPA